jgi:hypothetical protein
MRDGLFKSLPLHTMEMGALPAGIPTR